MLDSFVEEQSYFVEEIKKLVHNNKISHAYLIETRNYQDANSMVLSFAKYLYCLNHISNDGNCKECNLCSLIDQNANGDFIQIYPDGAFIKKKQILEIKEKFMTKPLSEQSKRVYIIYNADKLNKEAANSLLKFLEEPEDSIIAILVTENRYQVIDTIRSRCQIFSLINHNTEITFSDLELTHKIINCLEEKKIHSIVYLPIILENKYYNKEEWIEILTEMQYIYEQSIRKLESTSFSLEIESVIDDILKKNTEFSLLHKIEIIHNQLKNLEYNLNISLMLDNFIIKFCKID